MSDTNAEILSERVLVRLTGLDRDKLEKKAKANARSLSGYIRYLILCDLDRANGHPAPGHPAPGGGDEGKRQ